MKEILVWFEKNWVLTVFSMSCIVELTPIKFNPWSALFKYLSKMLLSDIKQDIESIKTEQKNQQKLILENEKDRIRYEVLDFANSCRNNRNHTREEFMHVISLNDKYEDILKQTGDKNGVFKADYQYILDLYNEKLQRNDFLA